LREGAAILLLVLMAAWIYRPWEPAVHGYVDFPELLDRLEATRGFRAAFWETTEAQAQAGRWSPVSIALIAAQWTRFGWEAAAWHGVRFVVLGLSTAMAYGLYRRLGLTVVGSFLAASLVVVAPGATMGWTRMSTPEPVGMLFLLGGAHIALRPWSAGARWGMAIMLLGTMWSKEMMVAAWALPVWIAYFAIKTRSDSPIRTLVSAFIPSAILFAVGLIPMVRAFLTAPPGAFATQYGSGTFPSIENLGAVMTAILPFPPGGVESEATGGIPQLALTILLVAGWGEVFRARGDRSRGSERLAVGLSMPVIGAIAYSPWPYYQLPYALPFLLGGALLTGVAASALIERRGGHRVMGLTCAIIVLSYSILQAANDASRTRAVERAFVETVLRVPQLPAVDTVLVAVAPNQFDPAGNFGVRFGHYAGALNIRWPEIRDIRCDAIPNPVPERQIVIIMSAMCAAPEDARALAVERRRFRWPYPQLRRDSVSVSILSAERR
jgi:hypothetical protein